MDKSGQFLSYSTYLGGTNYDNGVSIFVDNFKNTYIYGQSSSLNFPLLNPYQSEKGSVFITKLINPLENTLTNFHVNRINPTDVLLTWIGGNQDSYIQTGYELYYSSNTTKQSELTFISSTTETSMLVKGINTNQGYIFGVIPTYEDGLKGEMITYDLVANQYGLEHMSYHLRFPHVAQNNQWWTGIVAVNPSTKPITIDLKAIDVNGDFLESSPVLLGLNGGQKTVGLVSTYFSKEVLENTSWIDLESNGKLLGFELFGQDFANMSGVLVNGNVLHNGFLPIAEEREDRYVALSLINVSNVEESLVTFKGYSSTGEEVAEYSINLVPQGKDS